MNITLPDLVKIIETHKKKEASGLGYTETTSTTIDIYEKRFDVYTGAEVQPAMIISINQNWLIKETEKQRNLYKNLESIMKLLKFKIPTAQI